MYFNVKFKVFKDRKWTKVFGPPLDEKIIHPGRLIFFSHWKNFSTSQKDMMKNPDFRPTLKADEMAPCAVGCSATRMFISSAKMRILLVWNMGRSIAYSDRLPATQQKVNWSLTFLYLTFKLTRIKVCNWWTAIFISFDGFLFYCFVTSN